MNTSAGMNSRCCKGDSRTLAAMRHLLLLPACMVLQYDVSPQTFHVYPAEAYIMRPGLQPSRVHAEGFDLSVTKHMHAGGSAASGAVQGRHGASDRSCGAEGSPEADNPGLSHPKREGAECSFPKLHRSCIIHRIQHNTVQHECKRILLGHLLSGVHDLSHVRL